MRLKNRKGFTLAELLIVVAIIGILSSLAVLGVNMYIKNMTQREFDTTAKNIFIAAQNHLSLAYNEGYLDKTKYGTNETEEIYYYVVNSPDAFNDEDSMLPLMLPFGAIDDQIRTQGSYIIRYDRPSGRILDVFYSDVNDERYGYKIESSDAAIILALKGQENASARKNFSSNGKSNKIIGYWGGEDVIPQYGEEVEKPYLILTNDNDLKATVKVNLKEDEQLRLFVKGLVTGNTAYIEIKSKDVEAASSPYYDLDGDSYTFYLDSITESSAHFADFVTEAVNDGRASGPLMYGENIEVYAEASRDGILAESGTGIILSNIARSSVSKANSLFADSSTIDPSQMNNEVHILNFRHLENLDTAVSGFNTISLSTNYGLSVTKAVQESDIDWIDFSTKGETAITSINLLNSEDYGTGYYPVNLPITYEGDLHRVENITTVLSSGNAGLFSSTGGHSVKDLQIVNPNITATNGNAGALAGISTDSAIIENVLVNSESEGANPYFASQITATGDNASAGGLIGEANNVKIKNCASAIQVYGYDAGGLVGYAHSGTEIEKSYASGHTIDAKFDKDNPNIRGLNTAGGLVGILTEAHISKSYATPSVKALRSNGDAGGMVAKMTGSSSTISDSYTVSKVYSEGDSGAFISNYQGAGELTNVNYLEAANSMLAPIGSDEEYVLSKADSTITNYIQSLLATDWTAPSETNALPYDEKLTQMYQGYYQYESVEYLGGYHMIEPDQFVKTHYGDWPSYETILINE